MPKSLKGFSPVIRSWLPALLWMVVIIATSFDWGSGNKTFMILEPLLRWLHPDMPDAKIYDINFDVRKTAHVVEFAILSFMIWRNHGSFRTWPDRNDVRLAKLAVGIAAIFGCASEFIQIFIPSRTATVVDIFRDVGGAILGLLIIMAIKVIRGRHTRPAAAMSSASSPSQAKPLSPTFSESAPAPHPASGRRTQHPKILITSDLHLNNSAHGPAAAAQLRQAVEQSKPDLCIIAGDIGTPERADYWLSVLKKAVDGVPLAICLGNQDHWLEPEQWAKCPTPAIVRETYWRPALQAAGVHGLDFANLTFNDLVVTGGYGHFDFEMRDNDLMADGVIPTTEDYLRGQFAGLAWNDMRYLPNAAATALEEARTQADGIAHRLAQATATGKPVLVVTHTVPFAALNAHGERPGTLTRFLDAYAGNSLVGDTLAAHASKIQLAICGHTHTPVSRTMIQGVPCLNIGSDYGALRFFIFHPDTP